MFDGRFLYTSRQGRTVLNLSPCQILDGKAIYTLKSKSTNNLYVMLSKPAPGNRPTDDSNEEELEMEHEVDLSVLHIMYSWAVPFGLSSSSTGSNNIFYHIPQGAPKPGISNYIVYSLRCHVTLGYTKYNVPILEILILWQTTFDIPKQSCKWVLSLSMNPTCVVKVSGSGRLNVPRAIRTKIIYWHFY